MNQEVEQQVEPVRRPLKPQRVVNIACRTAHIGVTGVLVGGHVFAMPRDRLVPWLYLAVLSGAMLAAVEAYPRLRWAYQGRGAAVIGKTLLLCLCLVPRLWDYRVAILAAVIVIASVGSHMPARFRYYSLVHRRVID